MGKFQNSLHNVAVVVLALAYVTALVGGVGCLLWWWQGGGPNWAGLAGMLGLPACFLIGRLAQILEGRAPS